MSKHVCDTPKHLPGAIRLAIFWATCAAWLSLGMLLLTAIFFLMVPETNFYLIDQEGRLLHVYPISTERGAHEQHAGQRSIGSDIGSGS